VCVWVGVWVCEDLS